MAAEGMESAAESGGEEEKPMFRDIRRYYCEYCGICRSKKALIKFHVISHHKEEIQDAKIDAEKEVKEPRRYTCEECGAIFKKPAYLKQHMQGHSLERPFSCPVDDCHASYRRKDHLNRHLLRHEGKLFTCIIDNCNRRFAFQGNMTRHVNELHDDEDIPCNCDHQKLYTCAEMGCGKSFKYPSKLKRHEDSHVKLDSVETICCEPGCMKHFTNAECLKVHVQSCHRYIQCSDCGTQQLKKNFKRHQRIHEEGGPTETTSCSFDGCLHKFSNRSNLNKHVKAVHLEERPFACRISGCGKKFPFKHVRDNHEKSGIHAYASGDFLESDERFRLRAKGGRKRKCADVETLLRKRIAPPNQSSVLDDGVGFMTWLLGEDRQ